MGLKYNEATGEFYETSSRGGGSSDGQRGKSIAAPKKKPSKVQKQKIHRPAAPSLSSLRKLAAPLKLLIYPFMKWWEVEKEAIDDQAWFFAAMWLVPLLVLVGLYRLAFMMLRMILAYGVA